MKHKHIVLVTLVLAAACLLNAASANAVSHLNILGKDSSTTEEILFNPDGDLTLSVPAKSTEISCKAMELAEAKLISGSESSGTLLLSKCTTKLSGTVSSSCTPTEPIAAKIKDSLIEHAKEFYHLLVPIEGSTFTSLHFSEPCPLPDEVAVTGSVVLKCTDAPCGSKLATRLVTQASEELFPSAVLKYMGHTASLVGSAKVEVTQTKRPSLALEEKIVLTEKVTPIDTYEVACSGLTVIDGLLFVGGSGSGKLEITGCEAFVNKVASKKCTPQSPIVVPVQSLLFVHNTKTYILVAPATGGTFAVLEIPETCVIGGELPLNGTIVLECSDAPCSEERTKHLVRPASVALFGYSLTLNGKAISLAGSATVKLAGALVNEEWSWLG